MKSARHDNTSNYVRTKYEYNCGKVPRRGVSKRRATHHARSSRLSRFARKPFLLLPSSSLPVDSPFFKRLIVLREIHFVKARINNKIKCLLYQDNKTDVKELCKACWNQQIEENIKEEKEKKNMTFKELWIALHPGEEFIHDDNYEGKCPCNFNYETEKWTCPVVDCKACWNREAPEEVIKNFLKNDKRAPKFKVGDRVKLTNPITGCFGAENMIGIVTDEKARNGLYDSELFPTIHIKLEESGSTWCVNEDGCVLVTKGSANTASQTEKAPKFNIGDKVRVIHPEDGCAGCEGEIGIVTTEEAGNGLFGNEPYPTINIKIQDINSVCYNQIWCVNEDGCELISEAPALEKTTDDFPHFDDWTGKIIKLKSGKVYLVVSFDVA